MERLSLADGAAYSTSNLRKDFNLGIMSEMARCNPIIQYDFNHVVVQAAIEKKWNIVDALFQRDIEFNESSLQSLLLEAFKQRKKYILYGIMYSPFINLEKYIIHVIENEGFVNYIFRHYDNFDEDFINETFKSVVKSLKLRTVKLLISADTSYSVEIQTMLEAREMLTIPHNVGKDGHLQSMTSLLNQRLDVLSSELGHQITELNGHVQIPELCRESCHRTTCPRFHTLLDFYWQISLGGSYWLNLPQNIIYCLENTYCDPKEDGISLPRLDPSKPLHADLLCILGREVWRADFTHNSMKLKDSNSSKSLYLRRLHKDIPFMWYYQDDNGVWEEYKYNLTSEYIEISKLQNLNKINFQRNEFSYEISFNSMTQKNIMSGKIRNIKRRPKKSFNYSNSEDGELHELLPYTWDHMKPLEVVKMVKLSSQSREYQEVYNRIFNKQTLQSHDVNIERIQNPYLWRSFQNRFQEMKEQNCNPLVLKLFHCTSEHYLNTICQENIDYRTYMNRYSYGAHFSQSIIHAEIHSKSLNFNDRVFILANVAVGEVTTFDPSITRPPLSIATNLPFDTAVDNIQKPNLYVKYESQEYYPEYIIRMDVQTQNYLFKSLFQPVRVGFT